MAQEEQETAVVPVIRAGLCLVNTATYLTDEGICDGKSATEGHLMFVHLLFMTFNVRARNVRDFHWVTNI